MKEKVKKIVGVLLALMCVVAFAACGNLGAEEVAQYDLTSQGIKGTSIILVEAFKWRITINLPNL